ncbi:MAG: thioesterase family protein [Paludibacteraceae bacterium]
MKSYSQKLVVTEYHSASTVGSGFLNVFATPELVAFMENTAVRAIGNLDEGYTTVGVEINVKHLKASRVGEEITCEAILVRQEGKIYHFDITATDSSGDCIGEATHTRVAVEIERFMQKVNG